VIMDDPVFLPDGYIYDRSTAIAILGDQKKARCPLNKEIEFTLADITTCYCVRAALDKLREKVVSDQAAAFAAKSSAKVTVSPPGFRRQ